MSKRFARACECIYLTEELLSNYRRTLEEGSDEERICDMVLNFYDCYKPFLLDPFRDEADER